MEPPINLRKPELITFKERTIPVNEIAVVHDHRTINGTFLVLPHNSALSYTIGDDDPAYEDVLTLSIYLQYVWVEERDDEIIFYAHTARALAVLHEELEKERYHFTYVLGATHPNCITVFRNQGEEIEALDRELNLEGLIERFRTPIEGGNDGEPFDMII